MGKELFLRLAEHDHLETKRLRLRPVTLKDQQAMYAYASDTDTTKYIFPQHTSLLDTKENIAAFFLREPLGKYGIVLKETNQMIGTIDYHNIDFNLMTADIGYVLNKQFWGAGYTTEAANKLVEIAFEELGLMRLTAVYDERNPASGKVMEKIGMKLQGKIPYSRKHNDHYVTDICYQMTHEDYFQQLQKKN